MARPIKHNADYFSHDNNMRNDIKIKAIRRKYNAAGYALYIMILELLTSNEYFEIEWNEENIELLSPDFDMDVEVISEIVNYCIKLNLLQITNGYLHCETLTERLEETLLLRRKGYCSNNSKRMSVSGINVNNNSTIIDVSGINVNNNSINVDIYPQSKVKESKLKESKGKESIVNNSIEQEEIKLDKETIAIASKFDNLFSDIK
jgi:hypothetical protein